MTQNFSSLKVENLFFNYKNNVAIQNISFTINSGSFTSIIGTSGAGKSTLLKLLKGNLKPDTGNIYLDETKLNKISPKKCKIRYLGQENSLLENKTIYQNFKNELKQNPPLTKLSKEEQNIQIAHIARILGIESLMDFCVKELSSGQKQIAALGVAVISKPNILILDDPLSCVDGKSRNFIIQELVTFQKKLNITTIYATTKTEEALSFSDQILYLSNGRLLQKGTPMDFYLKPTTLTVASYFEGNYLENSDGTYLVRPNWIEVNENFNGNENNLLGQVLNSQFNGKCIRYKISSSVIKGGIVIAEVPAVLKKERNGTFSQADIIPNETPVYLTIKQSIKL